jgi:hypothetical protein
MIAAEARQLSIAQWHALVQRGTVLPMRIPLEGDSMRPLIRRNRDPVFIVPRTRPLRRGDIVLFESAPGMYVAHRVRRTRDCSVQTLGDNCWNPDPWIPSAAVLGVAVLVERDGRRIPLDNPLARALGRVWMAVLPLRRGYWRCRMLAGKCLRKIGWRR